MCVWKVCDNFFFFFDGVFGECNLQSVQINVGVFAVAACEKAYLITLQFGLFPAKKRCRWEHIKTEKTPPISYDRYARIIS